MPTYVTSREAAIHASVDGINFPSVQSWSTFQGGDPQGATSQLFPGNVMSAIAQPGPVTLTNVTVTRPYTREMHQFVPALRGAINDGMQASYTPTDADGNPDNVTISITGILKEVQTPSWDAKSGETVYIGLVMECNG